VESSINPLGHAAFVETRPQDAADGDRAADDSLQIAVSNRSVGDEKSAAKGQQMADYATYYVPTHGRSFSQ
jgi:hypothetical protein